MQRKRRKFSSEFKARVAHEPMDKQQAQLKTAFKRWKGGFEQVDDICIMGIRI